MVNQHQTNVEWNVRLGDGRAVHTVKVTVTNPPLGGSTGQNTRYWFSWPNGANCADLTAELNGVSITPQFNGSRLDIDLNDHVGTPGDRWVYIYSFAEFGGLRSFDRFWIYSLLDWRVAFKKCLGLKVTIDGAALGNAPAKVLGRLRGKNHVTQLGTAPYITKDDQFSYTSPRDGWMSIAIVYDSGWKFHLIETGLSFTAGVSASIVAAVLYSLFS